MLGNLLTGFIIIIIGVNLVGPVADQIDTISHGYGDNATNVTGAALTIVSLTPLLFSLGVMSAGVAVAVQGLKNAGVM